MSGNDAVYQNIRYYRNQNNARHLLGSHKTGIVITDQCASYHWLETSRHQFCLAHVKRNLQQMADYSGGGITAKLGQQLVLLVSTVFCTQHRYENQELSEALWRRRMLRLRKAIRLQLEKGTLVPAKRYAGRCEYILKYEQGVWLFLDRPDVPLESTVHC